MRVPAGGRYLLLLFVTLKYASLETEMRPFAAIVAVDPDAARRVPIDAMSKVFGFTPCESSAVAAVLQGQSANEYSGVHGISVNTTNVHLRNAMAKVNVNRQVDLVRAVVSELIWVEEPYLDAAVSHDARRWVPL